MSEYKSSKYISILFREFQKYINTELKPYGITSAEYSYLLLLYENDGELSQDDLHKLSHIDRAAITRAIASLEQKGYVTKRAREQNSRHFVVTLTDKAQERKNYIWNIVNSWNEGLHRDITKEHSEIVIAALQQMVKNIK